MTPAFTILFVCPDNALLGPMAEACLNARTQGACRAFSSAPVPAAILHPAAAKLLKAQNMALAGFQPKSWDLFAMSHAPTPDRVVFLDEVCRSARPPMWGRRPIYEVWPIVGARRLSTKPEAVQEYFRRIRKSVDRLLADLEPLHDGTPAKQLPAVA